MHIRIFKTSLGWGGSGSNMQHNSRTIDLVLSSHYAAMEIRPREVYDLSKVTCMINFRALILSAKVGLVWYTE